MVDMNGKWKMFLQRRRYVIKVAYLKMVILKKLPLKAGAVPQKCIISKLYLYSLSDT